jgi:pyrimidine-nucleoside phosphorylase
MTTPDTLPTPDTNFAINPVLWIEHKKQGNAHSEAEIMALVDAVMNGEMSDYQLAAWLMAVCFVGLTDDETVFLTKAFVESGQVLDLKGMGIEGITVDKHSTGGVGDKTTLVVAPLLAAAGLNVAKLSGRGLGFTGGTIDKLEAFPYFNVQPTQADFVKQIQEIGIALSAQTADLAPADGLFYALRDVTATVDNLSLIAASVMSKKIAAGADVIVLDIKVGCGAFMKTLDEAKALATLCKTIGERFDKRVETVISSMDAPLGNAIGHTTEILEVIDTLKGSGPKDLEDLCLCLAGMALVEAGQATTLGHATVALKELIGNGQAFDKLKQLVVAQGVDHEIFDDLHTLPQPSRLMMIPSPASGIVQSIDALKVAKAVKMMGGGRTKKDDVINLGVGVVLRCEVGESITENETLFELWSDKVNFEAAKSMVLDAIVIGEASVTPAPLILATSL